MPTSVDDENRDRRNFFRVYNWDYDNNLFLNPSVILSTIILAVVSFIMGRWFDLSILYVFIIVILYLLSNIRAQNRSQKLDNEFSTSSSLSSSAPLSSLTNLLSVPPELRPSWLMYPDIERGQFLNDFIHSVWPYLQQLHPSIRAFLNERVTHALNPTDNSTSSSTTNNRIINYVIAQIVVDDFFLGELPPQILGIKAYPQITTYILDLQLRWIGNPSLTLSLYLRYLPKRFSIPISVENIELEGNLRIELPFTATSSSSSSTSSVSPSFPYIDSIHLSCLHLPRIDMDFRTATINLMMFPLLHITLEQLFKIGIFRTMLYPLSISIPLSIEAKKQEGVKIGTTVTSYLTQNILNTSGLSSSSRFGPPSNSETTSEAAASGRNIASVPLTWMNLQPPIIFSVRITGLTYHPNDDLYVSFLRSKKHNPKVRIEGILLSAYRSTTVHPLKRSAVALSESIAGSNIQPLYHLRRRSLSVNNLVDTKDIPVSRSNVIGMDSTVHHHANGSRWRSTLDHLHTSLSNFTTSLTGIPTTVHPRTVSRHNLPSSSFFAARKPHQFHRSTNGSPVAFHQLSNNDVWYQYTNTVNPPVSSASTVIQATESQTGYEVSFSTVLSFTSHVPNNDALLFRLVQLPSTVPNTAEETEENVSTYLSRTNQEQGIGYLRIPCLQIMEQWYMNNGILPIVLTLPLDSVAVYDTTKPLYIGHLTFEISLQQQLSSFGVTVPSTAAQTRPPNEGTDPSVPSTIHRSSSVPAPGDTIDLHGLDATPETEPPSVSFSSTATTNDTLSPVDDGSFVSTAHQEALRIVMASPKTAEEKEEQHQKIMHLPPGMAATIEEETVPKAVSKIVQEVGSTVSHSVEQMKEKLQAIFHPPAVSFISGSTLAMNTLPSSLSVSSSTETTESINNTTILSPPVIPVTTITTMATPNTTTNPGGGTGLVSFESLPLSQITGMHLPSSDTVLPSLSTTVPTNSSVSSSLTHYPHYPLLSSNLPSIALGSLTPPTTSTTTVAPLSSSEGTISSTTALPPSPSEKYHH